MADIRPFRGIRYDPQVVGPLAGVICPPFDIISPELQSSLYNRSPHNVVRLEEGDNLPSDTPTNNRYTRAAATFHKWLEEGVLKRETEPAFYLARHTFSFQGQERNQLSLLACVRLEEYERRVVLPHEFTRERAICDRLALMEACNANFSPVMSLYRDREGRLTQLFDEAVSYPPLLTLSTDDQHDFSLWRIDQPSLMQGIREGLADKPLYIADGHHRYQTALGYRDKVKSGAQSPVQPDEAVNFVLMGLIEMEDPGLFVLPYHRVVGNLEPSLLISVQERLKDLFEFHPFSMGGPSDIEPLIKEVEERGARGEVVGLLGPGSDRLYILTLKERVDLKSRGPIASFEGWILEEMVFKQVLGDSLSQHLTWSHDAKEAAEMVRSGEQQMVLFLKPLPLELFEAIVGKGERLPAKSTFFYPKLPTGLVLNPLDESV